MLPDRKRVKSEEGNISNVLSECHAKLQILSARSTMGKLMLCVCVYRVFRSSSWSDCWSFTVFGMCLMEPYFLLVLSQLKLLITIKPPLSNSIYNIGQ